MEILPIWRNCINLNNHCGTSPCTRKVVGRTFFYSLSLLMLFSSLFRDGKLIVRAYLHVL